MSPTQIGNTGGETFPPREKSTKQTGEYGKEACLLDVYSTGIPLRWFATVHYGSAQFQIRPADVPHFATEDAARTSARNQWRDLCPLALRLVEAPARNG